MRKEFHSPESGIGIAPRGSSADDTEQLSEIALKILSDAEPDGISKMEFRRLAKENGIDEARLNEVLRPLIHYANIYFNADTGKYHYLWSSPLQWE